MLAKAVVWGGIKLKKEKDTHTPSVLGVVQMAGRRVRDKWAKETYIELQAAGKKLCQRTMKTLSCSILKCITLLNAIT